MLKALVELQMRKSSDVEESVSSMTRKITREVRGSRALTLALNLVLASP